MISDQTTIPAGSAHYKARSLRRVLILTGMTIALFLSFAVDLATGPANYPLSDVIFALLNPSDASDQLRVVIWEIRMPVALMALTVGAGLSTAGAQMQPILATPLASPFTLGISAAAGFWRCDPACICRIHHPDQCLCHGDGNRADHSFFQPHARCYG